MRLSKTVLPALVTLAIAFAGCGGGGDGGDPGSPLESALSFVGADTPFAVAIDTDVEGDQFQALGELADRFPFGDRLLEQLRGELMRGAGDVSYEEDVKPLLGNPFVVAATDIDTFTDSSVDDDFVAAIDTEDGDRLRDVLERSGAKESGERSGATLYDDSSSGSGGAFAVKGDTLIVAGSAELLDQALARAEGGDHLDRDAFEAALAGLPEDAVIRAYANVEALLDADPGAADARKVKWVRALRTLGLTAQVAGDRVAIDFDLRTEGDLSDAELPIAAGEQSPGVIDQPGQVNVGVRDLGQLVRFAESAGQAIDPRGFGQYAQAKRQIEKQLRVSLEGDLIEQLAGDTSLNFAVNGTFGVRAELEDPAAFRRTLARIADVLPKIARGAGAGTVGLAKPQHREDFYALAQPDGDTLVFGVIGDVFVLANDPARAGRLATADPAPVDGAEGSVALEADAGELANQILGQLGDSLGPGKALGGRLFTGPLGDLTGSLEASTDGIEGSFTLAVK